MNKVVAADHPDCAGGIVWSACELRWINAKLEQQAGRIKGMEAKLASFARGVKIQVPTDTMEQEFATHYRRGFDAGKTAANALIEQAREALFNATLVHQNSFIKALITDALAAIERHLKGEES